MARAPDLLQVGTILNSTAQMSADGSESHIAGSTIGLAAGFQDEYRRVVAEFEYQAFIRFEHPDLARIYGFRTGALSFRRYYIFYVNTI